MVRTGPQPTAPHDFWGQIGVSACVLLVPPLLAGAAVYSMLPVRGDGIAPSALLVSEPAPQAEPPLALSDRQQQTTEAGNGRPGGAVRAVAPPARPPVAAAKAATPATRAAAASLRPAALPSKQIAKAPVAAPAAAVPTAPPSASSAGVALAGAPVDAANPNITSRDVARALGPVPVQVTIMVAPKAAAADGSQQASHADEGAAPEPGAVPSSPAPIAGGLPSAAVSDEPAQEYAAAAGHSVHSHFRRSANRVAARQKGHEGQKVRAQRPDAEPRHSFSLSDLFSRQQSSQRKSHD
jgi:hypothetical protein